MDNNVTGATINPMIGPMTHHRITVPIGPEPFATIRRGSLAERTMNMAQRAGIAAANNPRSVMAGAAILAAGLLFANRRKALRGIDVAFTTVTAPVRGTFGWAREAIHRATGPSSMLIGPGAQLTCKEETFVPRHQHLNSADAQTGRAAA